MNRSDLVDIPVILKHETKLAYLVDVGDKEPVWLPKSQCEYHKEGRNEILTCPEWLAKDKGLI